MVQISKVRKVYYYGRKRKQSRRALRLRYNFNWNGVVSTSDVCGKSVVCEGLQVAVGLSEHHILE